MSLCNLCPRKCNVDRSEKTGFCAVTNELKVSRASLHMWEEPCVSGENGSGTVFFSGCNLRCVYCQNKPISRGTVGKTISVERLSDIFIELQDKGANNINLVTPDHYVNLIIKALDIAREKGLVIPIVYNTSSYCSEKTLKKLKGYVDVYLADFKYFYNDLGLKYSAAKDYFNIASTAFDEMFNQCPDIIYNDKNIIQKGVIARHLVLPGLLDNSKNVIKYLYDKYGDKIIISIMSQYFPYQTEKFPEINRKLTQQEYDEIVDFAVDIGVENAFVQEGESADDSFIPDFNEYIGV